MWIDTRSIVRNVILVLLVGLVGWQFSKFDLCSKLPIDSQTVYMIHYCGIYRAK